MKPLILSCSQASNKNELDNKYGKYHILNSASLKDGKADAIVKYKNTAKLTEIYNTWLTSFDKETVLVLAHDDVLIRDEQWIEKLEQGLKKYDVVGLAGGINAKITAPCLWHIMCPREDLRGRVSHVVEGSNGSETYVTDFGKQGRVLILDGLFLAFKIKTLLDAEVWFDQSNPCVAHFYDIDFSLTCNKKQLKLGTIPIDAVHNSPGLKKYTDDWLAGQAWFLQKFIDGKY